MPKHPPRLKVQHAKVIVTDAGVKRLTVCESCCEGKHILEGDSICGECRSRGSKIRAKRKRKLNSRDVGKRAARRYPSSGRGLLSLPPRKEHKALQLRTDLRAK
jgi:hypothetical protein